MAKTLRNLLLATALLTTACTRQPDLYRWRTEMDGNLVPRPPRARQIVFAVEPEFHAPQSAFRYLSTSETNIANGRFCTVTALAFTTRTETLEQFLARVDTAELPLDAVGYRYAPGAAFPERYLTVPETHGTIIGGKPARLLLVHPDYR